MSPNETAREHLDNALAASLAGNQTETSILEFEEAIRLGLPKEREAFAYILLGSEYAKMASRRSAAGSSPTATAEWERAETASVTGLRIDREEGINQFAERNNRSLLGRFDLIADIGGSAKAKDSLQLGIDHLNAMLEHCAYLPSQPLLSTLFTLGNLYQQSGDTERAIACWEQLCAAAPVDYVDASGREATLRRHARENIETARSSSGASPKGGVSKGCVVILVILALAILGSILSNLH